MIATGHSDSKTRTFTPIAIIILDPSASMFDPQLRSFIDAFHCCDHEAIILASPLHQTRILDEVAPVLAESCASHVWVYIAADENHFLGMNAQGEVGEFHSSVGGEECFAAVARDYYIPIEPQPVKDTTSHAIVHPVYHAWSPKKTVGKGLFNVATDAGADQPEGKVYVFERDQAEKMHALPTNCSVDDRTRLVDECVAAAQLATTSYGVYTGESSSVD